MLGDAEVSAYRYGDFLVSALYRGDDLVWQADPPEFVVEGTSFNPSITLRPGSSATLTWRDEEGAVVGTGTSPTITFPDATPRTVILRCTVPHDIETLNLGFHNAQDPSPSWSLPSSFNKATQPVTEIVNLQTLTGLKRFMCARTNGITDDHELYTGPVLTGFLNFSGMSHLEHIEVFRSGIQSAVLTGCTSLIRLCFEQTNVETLDLNPVAGNLVDLRAAYQQDETLELVPLDQPLSALTHFCTRRQALTNFPDMAMLPAIRQLWIWNCTLVEESMVVRSSNNLHSIILSTPTSYGLGLPNIIKHLDLAGQTFAPYEAGVPRIIANGVGMETLDFSMMSGVPAQIELASNRLDEASVDQVLLLADASGVSGGTLLLDGPLMSPPNEGLAAAASLVSRGWTVTYRPPITPGTLLWEDTFDRADGSGTAAVGNGWLAPLGGMTIGIDSGGLTFTGGTSYQRAFVLPAALAGITDYDVEIEIDASQMGSNFGLLARMGSDGTGTKVLMNTATTYRSDGATTASGGNQTLVDIPTSWATPGMHKVRARYVGTRMDLYFDDVHVGGRSSSAHNNGTNSGVGVCGSSPRRYEAIRVYEIG